MKIYFLLVLVFYALAPRAFSMNNNMSKKEIVNLHNRLTGVPPSFKELKEFQKKLKTKNVEDVTFEMLDKSPDFYNVVLKNFFTPWFNKDGDYKQPLNDASATAIGIVRDNIPFSHFFSEDILYHFDGDVLTNSEASLSTYPNDTCCNVWDTSESKLVHSLIHRY